MFRYQHRKYRSNEPESILDVWDREAKARLSDKPRSHNAKQQRPKRRS